MYYSNLNTEEQNFIQSYALPPQEPLTLEKINKEMNNRFGVKNRKRDIKSYLQNQLKYSYKKEAPTIMKGWSKRKTLLQSIFSFRVLLKIIEGNQIISIDECSF